MTEIEKLKNELDALTNEVAALGSDVTALEEQLATATAAAESAIVAAERNRTKATERAAVDAEAEQQRLATALRRRRLAWQAATAEREEARQHLAASQLAATIVELQTLIDETAVTAGKIDESPIDRDAWATVSQQIESAQRIYRRAGGHGDLFGGVLPLMQKSILDAWATVMAVTVNPTQRGPRDVEIPSLLGMLRIPRAHARAGELGSD